MPMVGRREARDFRHSGTALLATDLSRKLVRKKTRVVRMEAVRGEEEKKD